MARSLIRRFAVPGRFGERGVFIVSIVLICGLYWLDIEAPVGIHVRILYVFPLTAIALHSERMRKVLFGLALVVFCEIASLLSNHLSPTAIFIDGLITIAGLSLVVVLARAARKHYLETLVLATSDPLTKLHNRRSFESIGEMELARQHRYGGIFSLAVIDLDGFKKLNDSRGHHVGDLALKLLADILRENTRQSDSIARLGGDEFAILMPVTRHSDCTELCQQLSGTIASRMVDAGFPITASIGHTTFERAPKSMLEALQEADKAMYAAKASGKGRAVSLSFPSPDTKVS
jgi:diguanylate cyclase (GGDEF)-like protein